MSIFHSAAGAVASTPHNRDTFENFNPENFQRALARRLVEETKEALAEHELNAATTHPAAATPEATYGYWTLPDSEDTFEGALYDDGGYRLD